MKLRMDELNLSHLQECQKIFRAVHPMENTEATKTKLIGFGFQVRGGMTTSVLSRLKFCMHCQIF
jgi:hypothetical protein